MLAPFGSQRSAGWCGTCASACCDRVRCGLRVDRLAGNLAEIDRATDKLFAAVDEASSTLDVTLISTDVAPDGIKLIIAAGVPATVGDDGERLVIALERIVAATDRLDVRAGANIGLVFAADVGHPRRRTYTVMGDAVNLSARLAYRAEPGKVLASAALVDTLPSRFGVAWVPAFTVKGKRAAQMAAVVSVHRHRSNWPG